MKLFTKHPHHLGETYSQHFRFAAQFGIRMLFGGIACLLHAVFPFIFQKTGSNILIKTMQEFVERMPKVEDRILVLSKSIEKKVMEQSE